MALEERQLFCMLKRFIHMGRNQKIRWVESKNSHSSLCYIQNDMKTLRSIQNGPDLGVSVVVVTKKADR
jgi:hypothetical protein